MSLTTFSFKILWLTFNTAKSVCEDLKVVSKSKKKSYNEFKWELNIVISYLTITILVAEQKDSTWFYPYELQSLSDSWSLSTNISTILSVNAKYF